MLAKYHNFGIRNVKGFRMSIFLESEYQRRTLFGRHAHPHTSGKQIVLNKSGNTREDIL